MQCSNPSERPDFPDHTGALVPAILDVIRRAHWQTARSVDHVPGGAHAYVVEGWAKDDLTVEEFWLVVGAIRAHGREEIWKAPERFYDSGKRPEFENLYLYVDVGNGLHAYWHTFPRGRVPMLNRELVSYQIEHPTRRVIEPPLAPLQLQIADPNDATLHRSLADQEGSR